MVQLNIAVQMLQRRQTIGESQINHKKSWQLNGKTDKLTPKRTMNKTNNGVKSGKWMMERW